MAVPAAPSNQVYPGIIMADSWVTASITEFYIYAQGISRGEMLSLVGHEALDGTLTDGALTDAFQALTSKTVDLDTATLEKDTDVDSPHYGRLRINCDVV